MRIRIRGADRKVEAFPPGNGYISHLGKLGKSWFKMPFLGGYVKHLGDYFLTFPTGKKTNESESPTYTRCIRSLKQVSPCKAANLN